jgi:DNA-binding GntR family transcriptional regulator
MVNQLGDNPSRGKHPTEDVLYLAIVNAITDKVLRPGEHLNEAKLAEIYEVPRSRVRRVLERLREEEVVTFELNRGAFVCRPTVAEALHVLEARRHLEYFAIQMSCTRITPEDLADLRKLLVREQAAFDRGDSAANRIAGEFHIRLAALSGNPVLERMLLNLIRRGVLIQSIFEIGTHALCLTSEHSRIIDHIAENRPAEAIAEMAHHFDHIISSLDLREDRVSPSIYSRNLV